MVSGSRDPAQAWFDQHDPGGAFACHVIDQASITEQ